jgi:hypothetical protein
MVAGHHSSIDLPVLKRDWFDIVETHLRIVTQECVQFIV